MEGQLRRQLALERERERGLLEQERERRDALMANEVQQLQRMHRLRESELGASLAQVPALISVCCYSGMY
jgi:hypothetical protein